MQHDIPLLLPREVGQIYGVQKEPIASQLLCFFVAPHILTKRLQDQVRSGNFAYLYCCGRDDETTLHECLHATQVWLRLVSSNFITNLF